MVYVALQVLLCPAMTEAGEFVRLFPIPFRDLENPNQFSKWQWIEALIKKATDDHRKESYKISIDTIKPLEKVSSKNRWKDRYYWIDRLPVFETFDEIRLNQESLNVSLALLHPFSVTALEIKESDKEWNKDEIEKLTRHEQGLFESNNNNSSKKLLRKIPYDFYYHYTCKDNNGVVFNYKHKIVDWELGALYWTCVKDYGDKWEEKLRQKYEKDLAQKNLYFLMGNIHRFQNQWLIISVIYPPNRSQVQQDLF